MGAVSCVSSDVHCVSDCPRDKATSALYSAIALQPFCIWSSREHGSFYVAEWLNEGSLGFSLFPMLPMYIKLCCRLVLIWLEDMRQASQAMPLASGLRIGSQHCNKFLLAHVALEGQLARLEDSNRCALAAG